MRELQLHVSSASVLALWVAEMCPKSHLSFPEPQHRLDLSGASGMHLYPVLSEGENSKRKKGTQKVGGD